MQRAELVRVARCIVGEKMACCEGPETVSHCVVGCYTKANGMVVGYRHA